MRAKPADVIAICVLAAAALLSSWPYAAPGHPLTFDVWPHLVRQDIVYRAVREGFSPFYTFMFYSGYPVLRFYSPLFYILGGLLTFLTGGNLLLALRVLLVAVQLGSGAAMFLFLRRRGRAVPAAALGAAAFLLIPWRVRHIAVLANYPMSLLYLLLPLLFLALDRLAERPGIWRAAILGLLLAAALLSHVVYAAFAVLFLAAFWLGTGKARARFGHLALAGALGVGLAAFFVVPFIAEYGRHVYPRILMQSPAPDIQVALGLRPALGGYGGGYLGLAVLALAAVGVVSVFLAPARGRRDGIVAAAIAGLSLVLAYVVPLLGGRAWFLTLGLLPERLLLFFAFAAASLAAAAFTLLQQKVRFFGRKPAVLLAALVALLLADSLPAILRVRYNQPEEFLAYKPAVYSLVRSQRPTKVVDFAVPVDQVDEPVRFQAYPGMAYLFGGLASAYGPQYHQFAPRSMAYGYPWLNAVAADLADSTTRVLSDRSLKVLALLGVSHLVMEPRLIQVEQAGQLFDAALVKDGVNWDLRFVEAGRTPRIAFGSLPAGLALASSRVRPVVGERLVRAGEFFVADDWSALLDSVGVDLGTNSVSFIPVTSGPDSLPGQPVLRVSETDVRHQSARLKVAADRDCFLRLALSYYPWLRVTLDGEPVSFRETKDHFIWLRLPAGTHSVEVTAPLTPLRRVTLFVSGLSALACLGTVLVRRRRPDRNPGAVVGK